MKQQEYITTLRHIESREIRKYMDIIDSDPIDIEAMNAQRKIINTIRDKISKEVDRMCE